MTDKVASYVSVEAVAVLVQAAREIGGDLAVAIEDDATTLVQNPAALVSRLIAATAAVPLSDHLEWLAVHALELRSVPATTANRRTQAKNQRVLVSLVRDIAALEIVARLPDQVFHARTDLHDQQLLIETLLAAVNSDDSDDVRRSVSSVRTAVVQHVKQAASELPGVTTATPASTLPALVIAHDLYDDIKRDAEIVARNHLARPGFVPALPIEVLL